MRLEPQVAGVLSVLCPLMSCCNINCTENPDWSDESVVSLLQTFVRYSRNPVKQFHNVSNTIDSRVMASETKSPNSKASLLGKVLVKHSSLWKDSWLSSLGPLTGGIIAGVLHTLISPDHLVTIITLSACQGSKAFWFGIQWALAHLTGQATIGIVYILLRAGTDLETYEYYMDYMVGIILVAMGIYFFTNSNKFFDAEWAPKQATCLCHASLLPPAIEKEGSAIEKDSLVSEEGPAIVRRISKGSSTSKEVSSMCDLCGQSCAASYKDHVVDGAFLCDICITQNYCTAPGFQPKAIDESTIFAERVKFQLEQSEANGSTRSLGAMFVGILQGIACPLGVVGLMFLKAYTSTEIVVFIAVFIMTDVFAVGALAMAYGVLTERFVSATVARAIYFTSCSLAVLLGLAWLILNATGCLESMEGD